MENNSMNNKELFRVAARQTGIAWDLIIKIQTGQPTNRNDIQQLRDHLQYALCAVTEIENICIHGQDKTH
jgi:hypothetical protein